MKRNYYILGAGVTALVLAYELLKKGRNVTLVEKESRPGGLARTFRWHGIPTDLGPKIYHTPDKDILEYWKREFGSLFYEREHWSKNFKDGLYYDYPISHELIESLPANIKEHIKEDLRTRDSRSPEGAVTYHEYINAIAGDTLQEMFFVKYPEKLWGISTKELDANWAPKRVEIRHKSTPFYWGQWSAVGIEGSGSIIDKLYDNVRKLGARVYFNEKIKRLDTRDNRIKKIITDKKVLTTGPGDIVINTTPITSLSKFIGKDTSLDYRGIIAVYLYLNKKSVFPKGVDFIYIDDPDILFHRVSEQGQFIKKQPKDKNVYIFEITYSKGDRNFVKSDKTIVSEVVKQFESLGFIKTSDVKDAKVIRMPEVYPMFFVGYRDELSRTRYHIDNISNLYNVGSLAEYAYNDLQILFSKAIDMADLLTDRTIEVNKMDKTIPRLSFKKEVKIGRKMVGHGHPVFIIAEIGLNHNGDVNIAKKLIDNAVNMGADAVKLQTYKASSRVAKSGKTSRYAEKILGLEDTDYQMLEKYELSFEETKELFDYARRRILIFSTPFDAQSVRDLERLKADCYKIASFDLTNTPLLIAAAQTGKPLIISTGMSSLAEVEDALRAVQSAGNDKVVLMHCVSTYPCSPHDVNLKAIETMKNAFALPVGFSDHTIGEAISIAAAARGANVIEKHYTLNNNMEGPDHAISLDVNKFRDIIRSIRDVEQAIGDGVKQVRPAEFSTIVRFRKTMYAAKDIKAGKVITKKDITLKGPAYGIYPKFMDIVLGQTALADIKKDTPIAWERIGRCIK